MTYQAYFQQPYFDFTESVISASSGAAIVSREAKSLSRIRPSFSLRNGVTLRSICVRFCVPNVLSSGSDSGVV